MRWWCVDCAGGERIRGRRGGIGADPRGPGKRGQWRRGGFSAVIKKFLGKMLAVFSFFKFGGDGGWLVKTTTCC
uniref:Uncharacterized protein n=1 Tax=Leersia perrieri TaxID=77586 RepID=A0A0D9V6W6_9ORYZ